MGKLREPLSEVANCGLPAALEAIGERWSFMILRAAFNGVRHFEEFLSEIGIARNILANRLTRLTEAGILHRSPCPDDRRRVEYNSQGPRFPDNDDCIAPMGRKVGDRRTVKPGIVRRSRPSADPACHAARP
jgi:DNA-binding HxlR family transcriptional regulator